MCIAHYDRTHEKPETCEFEYKQKIIEKKQRKTHSIDFRRRSGIDAFCWSIFATCVFIFSYLPKECTK